MADNKSLATTVLGHLKADAKPGQIMHVEIRHESDCPIFDDGRCNCDALDILSGKPINRKYVP
jgi:hypothetical protein